MNHYKLEFILENYTYNEVVYQTTKIANVQKFATNDLIFEENNERSLNLRFNMSISEF